jgi:hypothetical protein
MNDLHYFKQQLKKFVELLTMKNNVPLGYSKPQTALGNLELIGGYGGLDDLIITVQKVEEMSEQGRAERKSPKITIEYKK